MKITVFCGSSLGSNGQFKQAAKSLGNYLASKKIDLVYGGGKVGLMGTIADAVLHAGGNVTGIIPIGLKEKEIEHTELTQLHVVPDMHARKAMMADLADAFIAMPGGSGTLEEFFEVWTWAQLGYHSKPCALYNVEGYFDKLIDFMDHMVANSLLKSHHRNMIQIETKPSSLVEAIRSYKAPQQKWT